MNSLKDFQKKNGSKVQKQQSNDFENKELNFVDSRNFNSEQNCLSGVLKAIKQTKPNVRNETSEFAILADGTAFSLTGNLKTELPLLLGKEICIFFKEQKILEGGFKFNVFEIYFSE